MDEAKLKESLIKAEQHVQECDVWLSSLTREDTSEAVFRIRCKLLWAVEHLHTMQRELGINVSMNAFRRMEDGQTIDECGDSFVG